MQPLEAPIPAFKPATGLSLTLTTCFQNFLALFLLGSMKKTETISMVGSLPDHARELLQCAALVDEPVPDHALLTILDEAETKNIVTAGDFMQAKKELLQRGLIANDNKCPTEQQETIARLAAQSSYFGPLTRAIESSLPAVDLKSKTASPVRMQRNLRFAILSRDLDQFNSALLVCYKNNIVTGDNHPIAQICNNPFDQEWFRTLPPQIQILALNEIYKSSLLHLLDIDESLLYLQDPGTVKRMPPAGQPSIYYLLGSILLLRGELSQAAAVIAQAGDRLKAFGLRGWLHFMEQDLPAAIAAFEDDLRLLRQSDDRGNAFFTGIEGLFYIIALLLRGDFMDLPVIRQYILDLEKIQAHNVFLPCYLALKDLVDCQENPTLFKPVHLLSESPRLDSHSILLLICGVASYWIDGRLDRIYGRRLEQFFRKAMTKGYTWLALEYGALLAKTGRPRAAPEAFLSVRGNLGMQPIIDSIRHEEPWQRALKALSLKNQPAAPSPGSDHRIAWLLRIAENGSLLNLIPKEQKITGKGAWTRGRIVALKKLARADCPYLTEQDRKICAALKKETAPWGSSIDFDLDAALTALVGHPFIFLEENTATPIELLAGQPELRIEQAGDNLYISLHPFFEDESFRIVRETRTRFRVIAINRELRHLAKMVGKEGLMVPSEARAKVISTINGIASHVSIHSSIDGLSPSPHIATAQARVHVHLLPVGQGFRVSFYVRPFDCSGPYFKPGLGTENIAVEINGNRTWTRRDLQQENANAHKAQEACPSLAIPEDDTWEWLLLAPEQCLQFLYELRELGNNVVVEWPEGKKMAVSPQLSFDQLRIRIRKKQNWFALDGQIAIDESLVLDMRQLLSLARKSSGRFLPLGHGQFLTLTNEFKKRLEEISSFAENSKDGVLIHPLAALTIEDLTSDSQQFAADLAWKEQIENLRRAESYNPEIPSSLRAELRDYQIEGFKWLARLAKWGVGACLADDMGLGKTVQALAIILDRTPDGPSLVVAPTSVCLNWQEEAERFVPTLKVTLFGGRNRKKLLAGLGPYHLLVVSYGMLQQETRSLSAIQWQTIVLDEAQAIKNLSTKRSKAAKALNGKFRMITTGTPIENHLGELWNLFDFINPGLLGSLDHFNQQFAIPIERHSDREALQRLKKVIKPFILRRVKSEVLEELPSRTEIILQVGLSKEERAFYEALRQEALASLLHMQGHEGQRHIKILAEIMKLRLACCNSRLVSDQVAIASSKLELFHSIVDELLENCHKALVFSQFVGHLTLIRASLDAKNIKYRYLDGNTPPRQRKREVDAFQAGDGDLFLISLKAGGLGLNLTAADFVIHMDPWWNPAVEDQASDRAHRYGQTQPVTIYRLVTQNTIEERIVRLHHDKKELAESLLEGTDIGGKISSEDLLALLLQH